MKKKYQAPETLLTAEDPEQMMAASNNYGQPEKGQDLGKAGETGETSGNLSRPFSVWDDDEEE